MQYFIRQILIISAYSIPNKGIERRTTFLTVKSFIYSLIQDPLFDFDEFEFLIVNKSLRLGDLIVLHHVGFPTVEQWFFTGVIPNFWSQVQPATA